MTDTPKEANSAATEMPSMGLPRLRWTPDMRQVAMRESCSYERVTRIGLPKRTSYDPTDAGVNIASNTLTCFSARLGLLPQIELLADTMIGGTIERNARPHYALQHVGQSGPRRVQYGVGGKVPSYPVAEASPQAFPSVEANVVMVSTRRDERRAVAV